MGVTSVMLHYWPCVPSLLESRCARLTVIYTYIAVYGRSSVLSLSRFYVGI